LESDKILLEAKRLYGLGMAIHWLHKKSKRPIESGWTTGPRKDWDYLRKTYRPGMNVGVRLGTPSRIQKNFLAVIDVDVKSTDVKHAKEVQAKLRALVNGHSLPAVQSGRGNGSRHLYILTREPMKPFKALQSTETVKVSMPSVKPSKRELGALAVDEIEAGIRLRPAWEIAVMGEGQQVVLPPSIHPDSGRPYVWRAQFDPALAMGFDESVLPKPELVTQVANEKSALTPGRLEEPGKRGPKTLDGFKVEPVELSWLPVSDKIRQMILTGEGVEDRSAMLLPVSHALHKAGLTQNEILSVLTEPTHFLGQTAYHHAKTKDRWRAAAWLYRYTLRRVIDENTAERFFTDPLPEPVKLSPKEIEEQQVLFNKLHSWRLDLDVTKDDKIRGTLRNTVSILENEVGAQLIKRDTFAYRDFYSIPAPWGGELGAALTDDDIVKIKLWISSNFGCEPTSNIIGEALTILATRNAFDPVADWLKALPAWDESPRLDTWLKDHFGAKGDEDYLAQVFRKWLVAMVMRILKPGAKFDWMPIFEGAQGVGKSSFGRLLCGDKYFLDWLPDLANKDSALALQGIWSVEMGELASFRKNEIETVKAFITRTVDKVRPPYGERWLEVPRRCVFFGTTNFETYLRDESGNRRFKPVKVGRLDFEMLEQDRTQLFAEALWLYQTGFETERTLEISGDAKIYEASIQAQKMVSDESALMLEALQSFIEKEVQKEEQERFPFSRFKMADLFDCGTYPLKGVPALKNWKYDSRNVQFAGKALKNLGAANFKSHGMKLWKITI
jgi:predicted P-loop ATPase